METAATRGRLKVFLGYAAGVGKTFQMLTEAKALRQQGVDVVIAYFESHGRKDTIAQTDGLETIPRRTVEYRGSLFEEMDTEAVLARRPAVALVDEFPHTNVPGSARAKRFEDVHVLLDAGIDVTTTMNVQHLESLNDQIWQATGVRVRETVPDWVLHQADEIVMVDVTPRALLNRLQRGVVYPPERARAALEHFFQEHTLVALRELAMRQTAHAVETRQVGEDEPAAAGQPAGPTERLLLLVDPHPAGAALLRRGRRVADYLHADCFAVYVSASGDLTGLDRNEQDALTKQFEFAKALHIATRVLQGRDVAQTLVEFARSNGVTQIFLIRRNGHRFFGRNLVQRIVSLAGDMQVTVVADRTSRPS